RHRLFARLRDHRGGNGQSDLDHDRGYGPGHAGHVVGVRPCQRLRGAPSEREDPGPRLPPPHRRHAGRGGDGQSPRQRVYILRDGLLALRRNAQPALPKETSARLSPSSVRTARIMTPRNVAMGPSEANAVRGNLLAGAIGSVLEWYDFAIYGYLAPLLGKLF